MVKLQQNSRNNNFFLNIPKDIVTLKNWKKGDEFQFIEDNGEIILRKMRDNNGGT